MYSNALGHQVWLNLLQDMFFYILLSFKNIFVFSFESENADKTLKS